MEFVITKKLTYNSALWKGLCRTADGDGEVNRRGRHLMRWMILITRSFFHDSTTLVGPDVLLVEIPRLHCVRHITLGRTPVDE
jgi:hypothetical protein